MLTKEEILKSSFSDIVWGATGIITEDDNIVEIYNLLPNDIIKDINRWEIEDTVIKDNICEFLQTNACNIIEIVLCGNTEIKLDY